MSRDQDLILAWVGGRLEPVPKLRVHELGLRHPAVSVFVMDGAGRTLIQQRAFDKYHCGGLWANSCCTHPHPGETAADCAARRVAEELGITGLSFDHRGQVEYRAEVSNGLIEHEVVELFVATKPQGAIVPAANPDEVAAVDWQDLAGLCAAIADHPDAFTPWLRIYLDRHAGLVFPPASLIPV